MVIARAGGEFQWQSGGLKAFANTSRYVVMPPDNWDVPWGGGGGTPIGHVQLVTVTKKEDYFILGFGRAGPGWGSKSGPVPELSLWAGSGYKGLRF